MIYGFEDPMSAKDQISGFYRQYYKELHRFLYARLHCKDEASDVLQEVFARLLAFGGGDQIRQPRAFLYRAALNLVVDGFRTRKSRLEDARADSEEEEPASCEPGPDSVMYSRQRLKALQRAIDELPPRCREVFLLHKFENRSHTEIADHMGISRNMVEKHVIKAVTHCRNRLAQFE